MAHNSGNSLNFCGQLVSRCR